MGHYDVLTKDTGFPSLSFCSLYRKFETQIPLYYWKMKTKYIKMMFFREFTNFGQHVLVDPMCNDVIYSLGKLEKVI